MASRRSVSILILRRFCSIRLICVRCNPAAAASASCDNDNAARFSRTRWPMSRMNSLAFIIVGEIIV
jgi:hypothetical protein